MLNAKAIGDFNQRKYEHDYTIAQMSIDKNVDPKEYFRKLIEVKLGFVRKYGTGKHVLDVGCGSGDFLLEARDVVSSGCGVDYTNKAVEAANSRKNMAQASQLEFIKAGADHLPFKDGTFDLVFSFAALVYIPELKKVVHEIARVLKLNGVAVLEMGNCLSLNTLVCQAHPDLAKTCPVQIASMKKIIFGSKLQILEWKAFGILPFWGQRPSWLKPLLHPRWKMIFQKEVQGKMLDEWVSNLFFLRPFAYRHFFVCRKG